MAEKFPRFLLVVTEVLIYRGLNAGLQIADKKNRVGPYPLYRCKIPGIGRDRRGHRATRPAGNAVRLPGLACVALDNICRAIGVLVVLTGAARLDNLPVLGVKSVRGEVG